MLNISYKKHFPVKTHKNSTKKKFNSKKICSRKKLALGKIL